MLKNNTCLINFYSYRNESFKTFLILDEIIVVTNFIYMELGDYYPEKKNENIYVLHYLFAGLLD